ncbi:MAG: hypothetical protein QOI55_495 [Actinomycetota bacterium]|nr:hypothetical protein [Actinomycetota bacterium]
MHRFAAFVAVFLLCCAVAAPAHAGVSAPNKVIVYGDSVVYDGQVGIAAKLSEAGWNPQIVSYPGVDVGQIAYNVMNEPTMSDVVVLGVGYTYFWKPFVLRRQIDSLFSALTMRGVRRVIWLNVRENRAERRDVNDAINAAAQRWPIIDIADWNTFTQGHDAAFKPDGYHLLAAGGQLMGDFIAQHLAAYRAGMPCAHDARYGRRLAIRPAVEPNGAPNTRAAAAAADQLARRSPFVGIAPTRTGKGYWLANRDGGVENVGDARPHGSLLGMHLKVAIVGMAGTPSGRGYWLVASDGGVFAFGDAPFRGSAGGLPLRSPMVGIAATPSGRGYWLVASDGGVFSFGDARFFGSTGAMMLSEPIVGIAAHPSGHGYWLVAWDGGIFTFGAARFHGSAADHWRYWKIEGMAPTPDGRGYWLLDGFGNVLPFGSARPAATFPRAMDQLWSAIAARPGGGVFVLGQSPAHTLRG